MRPRFLISITSQNRLFCTLFLLVLVSIEVLAIDGLIPVDDTEITLSDGREILIRRDDDQEHSVILKDGQKVLWEQKYHLEYDRLWQYAFFVPVKKGKKYAFDLNGDGAPEIAIGTWDGGNNMKNRDVLLFTVTGHSLEYYGRAPFNLEFGEYVFE